MNPRALFFSFFSAFFSFIVLAGFFFCSFFLSRPLAIAAFLMLVVTARAWHIRRAAVSVAGDAPWNSRQPRDMQPSATQGRSCPRFAPGGTRALPLDPG